MYTYRNNGELHEAHASQQTWGDLLKSIEQGEGPGRLLVTAVRFAGVDEPSFQSPSACEQRLSRIKGLDLDTSTASQLIDVSADSALAGLEPLAQGAVSIGRAFRRFDVAAAQHDLGDLVTALQTLTTLTAMLAAARGVEIDLTDTETRGVIDGLHTGLAALANFQEQQDWIAVADVLEGDLAPLLPRWAHVVTTLKSSGDGAVTSRIPVAVS